MILTVYASASASATFTGSVHCGEGERDGFAALTIADPRHRIDIHFNSAAQLTELAACAAHLARELAEAKTGGAA